MSPIYLFKCTLCGCMLGVNTSPSKLTFLGKKYPDHLYDSISSLIAAGTRGLKCDGGKAEWGPPPNADRRPRVAKPFEVVVKLMGEAKNSGGGCKNVREGCKHF